MANALKYVEDVLSTAWWIFLFRGLSFMLLGGLLLLQPVETTVLLILVLGVYILIDGIFSSVFAIANHDKMDNWGLELLRGIIGILVGLFAMYRPMFFTAVTATSLLLILGLGLLVLGVLQFIAMLEFKSWTMFFSSIMMVILGALYFAKPALTATIFITITGVFMLLGGLVQVVLAFRLEKAAKKVAAKAAKKK